MNTIVFIGAWIVISCIGYKLTTHANSDSNLKIMSCRKRLKQYKRIDEADNNSLW